MRPQALWPREVGESVKEERTEARAVDGAGLRADCQVVGAAKSRENREFILGLSN